MCQRVRAWTNLSRSRQSRRADLVAAHASKLVNIPNRKSSADMSGVCLQSCVVSDRSYIYLSQVRDDGAGVGRLVRVGPVYSVTSVRVVIMYTGQSLGVGLAYLWCSGAR